MKKTQLMKERDLQWEIVRKLRLAERNAAERSASPGEIARRLEAIKRRKAMRDSRQKERAREKREASERSASPLFGAITERKRNVDDRRQNAMAALRAQRDAKATRVEHKQKKQQEQEKDKDKDDDDDADAEIIGGTSKQSVKLKASDIYSDDSGSDSDDNKSTGRRSSTSSSSSSAAEEEKKRERRSEEVEVAIYADSRDQINKLRLSRFELECLVHLPFFARVVTGCFVRINIGHNSPVYMVAEIIDVYETAKIYNLGNTRTNKRLKLRHGTQDWVFSLKYVSNQEFTDGEFQKWIKAIKDANKKPPTMDFVSQSKITEVKEALMYEFKEEDIEKIVAEKERFRSHPTNYAMKKTQLMKERDVAQLRGDDETVMELNAKIQELEERANQLDKIRTSSIQSISYINNRNRKLNVETAEKAIMEEVKAMKGKKTDDPFTRRHTKPVMNFKSHQGNRSQRARPLGRSSLRAVRVKPGRPSHAPAHTPPIPPLRADSASSSPVSAANTPITNFGIHHPPVNHTHSDDEVVEVPYKPKTPEIIDLDEYPESPQGLKKKKLDILKERGLEVTAIPTPAWPGPAPLPAPLGPLLNTSPMLLNPAMQHQIMTQAQLFQMYNIVPPNFGNGLQPPKVIQATSIFGSAGPEKTVYGNPKDPFMPPPHILHGAPLKPPKNVPATEDRPAPTRQDILDLTCKNAVQKPAVEIVRLPTTPSPSKVTSTVQNLSKNYTLIDGKAVVGSNLEITLVNPKNQSPSKSKVPQKRSSNGKFVSTKTPPKDYKPYACPSPSGVQKKPPIIVPNYQVSRDDVSPTNSNSSRESQQSTPDLSSKPMGGVVSRKRNAPGGEVNIDGADKRRGGSSFSHRGRLARGQRALTASAVGRHEQQEDQSMRSSVHVDEGGDKSHAALLLASASSTNNPMPNHLAQLLAVFTHRRSHLCQLPNLRGRLELTMSARKSRDHTDSQEAVLEYKDDSSSEEDMEVEKVESDSEQSWDEEHERQEPDSDDE